MPTPKPRFVRKANPERSLGSGSKVSRSKRASKEKPVDGGQPSRAARASRRPAAVKPRLLAGGNPQIAKADGDAPVGVYIGALPGWKRAVVRRLDTLIARTVPGVRKCVRWNSPLYGVEGQGWFLGCHCSTKCVKVAFFRGTSLQPLPPGASKSKETRYLDLREGDELDSKQLASWIEQASSIPGWNGGSPSNGGIAL